MRNGSVTILSVVLLLTNGPLTSMAFAQECKEPVAVTKPCEGVLLPPKAAESGLKCLKVEVPRLTLELDYLKKERTSFGNYHELILKAEKDRSAALQRQVEILLKKDTGQKWYEHPAFHFALGFVTASAVTIGITYAVNND